LQLLFYAELRAALDLGSDREIEDLIIQGIYAGLIEVRTRTLSCCKIWSC
jgi:hypothetical protein